jgi:hypothetical protein
MEFPRASFHPNFDCDIGVGDWSGKLHGHQHVRRGLKLKFPLVLLASLPFISSQTYTLKISLSDHDRQEVKNITTKAPLECLSFAMWMFTRALPLRRRCRDLSSLIADAVWAVSMRGRQYSAVAGKSHRALPVAVIIGQRVWTGCCMIGLDLLGMTFSSSEDKGTGRLPLRGHHGCTTSRISRAVFVMIVGKGCWALTVAVISDWEGMR